MSKIINTITFAVALLAASLFAFGCQEGKNNILLIPDNQPVDLAMASQGVFSSSANVHYLWGYYLVKIDTATLESEVIPTRQASSHQNVLKFLEQGPCTTCFKIAGITPGPSGTLNIDINIKHPFAILNLTGFDVRGIAMFNGSKVFPVSGLTMSDSTLGDGELLNPDGYTTLYNPTTVSHGPFEGYFKGKSATGISPDATLNGFKRFITDNPANTRNAFYAGDSITVTYQVKKPNPFIFGYAIDASWSPPLVKPVINPMTDFGLDANCPEPWKIEVSDLGPGLSESGGTTVLQVNVYDRGGKDSHKVPVVECPDLFSGSVMAVFVSESAGYSTWHATIGNSLHSAPGDYSCLISVEDNLNDPIGKPWMNLTGFRITTIHVSNISSESGNLLWAKRAGGIDDDAGLAITTLSDNSTVVTGGFGETAIFGLGEPNQTQLVSTGWSNIFIACYNPDGSLEWAKRAGGGIYDYGQGIATLSDNSTVVTGDFMDTAIFGPGESNQTQLVSTGVRDIFIARYNTDGSLAWAKHAGGTDGYYDDDDYGYGITALSDDSTVVTGEFNGTATFGKDEPNQTQLVSVGYSNIFIARYNTDGSLAWAKRAGGTIYDYGLGISTLSDNSVVVTGSFSGTATFGPDETNQTKLVSSGKYDIFIARYKPDGSLAWAKCAGGTDDDHGHGIATLSDNSTVVTGYFWGTATFGPGETNQIQFVSDGGWDIFIARYNPDGNLAWAKRAGELGDDGGYGITTLSDNSIVVTGYFNGIATFGPDEANQTQLVSDGEGDIFIARYNTDGSLACAKRAGGLFWDEGYGITTLSDNSTISIGYFNLAATFGPGEPNQTHLFTAGGTDIFIARFTP